MYNTKYVYYTEDGTVTQIRAIPPEDGGLYFEIDLNLVLDFVVHYKSFDNYKIDYFLNLAKGLTTEVENTSGSINVPYIIPVTSGYKNEITIEHNRDFWSVKVRDDVKDKIQLYNNLKIYVCKKDNLSCMYIPLTFDLTSSEGIPFTSSIETDLSSLSLVTGKLYKSYGIKEIK